MGANNQRMRRLSLARTHGLAVPDRRKLLNDALTLATAGKKGLIVLTANVVDFDLLCQVVSGAPVLYYSAA